MQICFWRFNKDQECHWRKTEIWFLFRNFQALFISLRIIFDGTCFFSSVWLSFLSLSLASTMKISHRQLRLILRIIFTLGLCLGFLVFIYDLVFQRSMIYTLCYIAYLAAGGSVLYLLFARKRPSNRFAYGAFFGMCFVTVLFFLGYIYESATLVSKMTRNLIEHIEEGKVINSHTNVLIKLSKWVAQRSRGRGREISVL